jgi:hypothetical protein
MPATVTVPAGETETTFTVTAGGPVTTLTNVAVTAGNQYVQVEVSESILAPEVASITLTPSTVEGGDQVTIDVTLSEPVAAGTVVHFGYNNSHAYPGPALTLTAGQTTAQRTFTTRYVLSTATAVLTAYIDGPPVASATLTLNPLSITLDSISLSPTELVGSNPATLTVNLTAPAAAGGLVVDLNAFPAGASLPPFVLVPAGQTSVAVPVETTVTTEAHDVYLSAHHGATDRSTQLRIDPPPANFVDALTLATSRTAGGNLVTATVTLNAAAGSGGAVIALESDNLAVATVPASVTVSEGNTTATFDIDTDAVTQPADVTIRATYSGVIRTARLTVVPTEATVSLESLSLSTNLKQYGGTVTATVTLSSAAPAGGIVVALSGSRAGVATFPASVTVPEGATAATFTITAFAPDYARSVLVTATYDGLVRSSLLTVVQGPE